MRRLPEFLFIPAIAVSSCVYHDIPRPIDCQFSGPVLMLDAVTNASDCSASDGAISVTASGGEEPYVFLLNDQTLQATGNFQDIKAGVYSVRVRDRQGCEAGIENIPLQAEGLLFTAEIQPDNLCATNNGSVVINMQEGNAPYQYKLHDGEFTDNNTFVDLPYGEHAIQVKDVNDCVVDLRVTIPRGNTGVSWSNDILPVIINRCAIPECHNGISRPDLRIYQTAKFYANPMKTLTQNRSMPFDGTLTQEQIDLIACWVDDGAPEN